jgi:hypothetical protein
MRLFNFKQQSVSEVYTSDKFVSHPGFERDKQAKRDPHFLKPLAPTFASICDFFTYHRSFQARAQGSISHFGASFAACRTKNHCLTTTILNINHNKDHCPRTNFGCVNSLRRHHGGFFTRKGVGIGKS